MKKLKRDYDAFVLASTVIANETAIEQENKNGINNYSYPELFY